MQIDREDIEELKKIYTEDYGEALTDSEAMEMGQRLLNLFQVIYRPLPPDSTKPIDTAPPEI